MQDKTAEASFKLIASADAKPANQPFRLVLRETESGALHPVQHFLTTTGENNGVPQGFSTLAIDSTDRLWLTVSADPPVAPKKKKK